MRSSHLLISSSDLSLASTPLLFKLSFSISRNKLTHGPLAMDGTQRCISNQHQHQHQSQQNNLEQSQSSIALSLSSSRPRPLSLSLSLSRPCGIHLGPLRLTPNRPPCHATDAMSPALLQPGGTRTQQEPAPRRIKDPTQDWPPLHFL